MSEVALAPLAMVAALTPARVIGWRGSIPWHLPEDLRHFREVTLNHAVIMGRATHLSIGKPLAKRRNIVLSRYPALRIAGCEVASSLDEALRLAREYDDEPRIIGGGEIYARALPLATRLYLTRLDEEHEGDTYFPALCDNEWQETERWREPGVTWVTLEREVSRERG